VEAWAGRKISGWPFGRFDVGRDGLRVRLGFPWFVSRSAGQDTITAVTVSRRFAGIFCLRFEDTSQCLAHVLVGMPVRGQQIVDELRRSGYPVVDRKTGEPVSRLYRRLWN
jgi:hypothetical protein